MWALGSLLSISQPLLQVSSDFHVLFCPICLQIPECMEIRFRFKPVKIPLVVDQTDFFSVCETFHKSIGLCVNLSSCSNRKFFVSTKKMSSSSSALLQVLGSLQLLGGLLGSPRCNLQNLSFFDLYQFHIFLLQEI